MDNQMKKTPVKPIWVSDIKPVSVDGRVRCWNIDVRFDGDLASWHNENPLPRNIEQFKKYMNWTDADIKKMEDDDVNGGHKSIEREFFEFKRENAFFYKTDIPYILRRDIDIPQNQNISTIVWDEKSKVGNNKYANTLVCYVFLNGWLRFGHWRAQNFRNRMLAQMAKTKNENIK